MFSSSIVPRKFRQITNAKLSRGSLAHGRECGAGPACYRFWRYHAGGGAGFKHGEWSFRVRFASPGLPRGTVVSSPIRRVSFPAMTRRADLLTQSQTGWSPVAVHHAGLGLDQYTGAESFGRRGVRGCGSRARGTNPGTILALAAAA